MKILRTVSVSGGKDSTVLYRWAVERFGKDGFKAFHFDTDHDHPVVTNYVRNLPELAGGPPITILRPDFRERLAKKGMEPTGHLFLDMMLWKVRAPSRRGQFCTEHLKLAPMKAWLEENNPEDLPVIQYIGIRAGESAKRAKMKRRAFATFFMELDAQKKRPKYKGRDKGGRVYTFRPLLRWSEEQIFAYLADRGIPPNPLYGVGFGRVGCFPCINAGKRELSRLPDWAWERLEKYEAALGSSWFSWGILPPTPEQKALFDRLPRDPENPKYPDPDAYDALIEAHREWMPTVAQVREWSKTTRGGLQFDLLAPRTNDVPSCMSTWGACE